MPPRIKIILCIVVAVVAVAVFLHQTVIGLTGPSYAALLFGAISIISMWIFPEVSHDKSKRESKDR